MGQVPEEGNTPGLVGAGSKVWGLTLKALRALGAVLIVLVFTLAYMEGLFPNALLPLILFMAPVYVPLDLITGWVNGAASYNPLTAVIEAGRGFLAGQPETVGLAYLAGAGLVALGLVWAVTGLRRAERGV